MGDGSDFDGVIGRYRSDSTPAWPRPVRPPAGSPNVVLVVLDDVGFAQLGCFGGSTPTPTIDALAARGLRFTNFHTTSLCSPTRAALLTGRNHHSVGMGRIVDLATGFPGYDARIPDSAGMLPAVLTDAGWAAYAVGKWHLTPDDELHMGAPRTRWPLGKGFERFYGFMEGETNQFAPTLFHDNHATDPPRGFDDGYHLTEDLADQAITMLSDLRNADPDKPFLLYLATGACHSPHQAPRDWVERFAGAFDHGWDVERERIHARQVADGILPAGTELSPLPEWVPAWTDLSEDERRLYARYMECFAAHLSFADHQLGRVLEMLGRTGADGTGELDNTVVVVLSDNGASSEGGPTGSVNDVRPWNLAPRDLDEALDRIEDIGGPWIHNNYPWGWTVAGNTPFRRWKRETHEGGICDPLVLSWPAGIDADQHGSTRRQYVHAVDVAPTLLDILGVDAPEVLRGVAQMPIEGSSFTSTFADPRAAEVRTRQYFEMLGCRAMYADGWKAVTYRAMFDTSVPWDEEPWELYHVAVDPSECHDLAAEHPERVAELDAMWWAAAQSHQVLPLDNAPFDLVFGEGRPDAFDRARYVYLPGRAPVPESVAVNVRDRTHTVTADVELPDGPVEGVLVAQGSGHGGWSLFVEGGRLRYVHNFVALERHEVDAPMPGPGTHTLAMHFERTASHVGVAHLVIDGDEVASVEVPRFTPVRWSITGEGLCCGFQDGLPVSESYRAPFRFTGELRRVVIDVDGPLRLDPRAEGEVAVRAQ